MLKLIYPENLNCVICSFPVSVYNKYSLCRSCYEKMIFIHNACGKCGKPLLNEVDTEDIDVDKCPFCKNKSFLFDRNISFVEYGKESKSLVFGLKYKKKTYLAKIIAEIMVEELINNYMEIIKEADYITFVPLNKKRLKKRGFNQSEKICEYVYKGLYKRLVYEGEIFVEKESKKDEYDCEIPIKIEHKENVNEDDCLTRKLSNIKLCDSNMVFKLEMIDALYRNVNTVRLSKLKAKGRKNELRGVFDIKSEYKDVLKKKNIIIIDDIFTTGATINEISKVLLSNNVAKIVSLTFLTGKYEK